MVEKVTYSTIVCIDPLTDKETTVSVVYVQTLPANTKIDQGLINKYYGTYNYRLGLRKKILKARKARNKHNNLYSVKQIHSLAKRYVDSMSRAITHYYQDRHVFKVESSNEYIIMGDKQFQELNPDML